MDKAALVARLKKEYAAEDYFTGVLGNRHSVYLRKPKPARRKTPAVKQRAPASPAPAKRSGKGKARAN